MGLACHLNGRRLGVLTAASTYAILVFASGICEAGPHHTSSRKTASRQEHEDEGGDDVQSIFYDQLDAADRLYHRTQNVAAATAIIRAAMTICPSCQGPNKTGQFSSHFFMFEDYSDRIYMAESIIPALASYKPKQILWVGLQSYTMRTLYQLANLGATVSSIEPDEGQAVYGAEFHHLTAKLQDLHQHVTHQHFDAIIINGVIGWGIDGPEATLEAVKVMHTALQKNGILVVGWNKNMGTCCDFEPYFRHQALGSLPSVVEVSKSETQHVYEFFRKSELQRG